MEIAVEKNILSDSVFAFDLRNLNGNSYFYVSSSSFPTNYKYSSLVWFDVLTDHYWSMGNFTSTVISGTTYT